MVDPATRNTGDSAPSGFRASARTAIDATIANAIGASVPSITARWDPGGSGRPDGVPQPTTSPAIPTRMPAAPSAMTPTAAKPGTARSEADSGAILPANTNPTPN